MQGILHWLERLPPLALYAALAAAALAENVFPPLPADTVVAFGSFLAARGNGSALGAFLSTWAGNVAGAMIMYAAGRRYGSERLLARLGSRTSAEKIQALYGRYGLGAIAMSRLLPGVRAVVPPFAGALRIPALYALLALAIPSGLWYGAVTLMAYRVGANWEDFESAMGRWQRGIGMAAVVIAAIVVAVILVRRRRRV